MKYDCQPIVEFVFVFAKLRAKTAHNFLHWFQTLKRL